jgi:pyruvate ferredoxin oxidoreductase delta subunit
MCKGVESWAWYGVQPINRLVQPGGVLIVTSNREPDELLEVIRAKDYPWTLAIIPSDVRPGVFAPEGTASFGGLWVYNDDNTDYYCMAAVARVAPFIVGPEAVLDVVRERTKDETRVAAVRAMADRVKVRAVAAGEGSPIVYEEYVKPGWTKMREGIVVEAQKVGTRNPLYKKWSTRTRRPLVNFDTCIKCTQCWLQCPDECFEVTPEGTYEVVYEACIGCAVCEEVCPVPDCIAMVNELDFDDNDSLYTLYQRDPDAYRALLTRHGMPLHPELIDKARKTQPVHQQPTYDVPTVAGGEE